VTNLDWLREFIGASASDITSLRQARDALLTHPKIDPRAVDADAAMCRALILTAVTAVERIIEAWRDEAFLQTYNDKDASNGKKIALLRNCLEAAGVATNPDILEDYLAIKYLRNTLVHLKWIEAQRQQIQQRDFPTDLRRLDHRHWMRIIATLWHMLGYFSQAALRTGIPLSDDRLMEMEDLEIATEYSQQSRLVSLLLRGAELPTAWWRNLENLTDWISRELLVSADETSRLFSVALDSWRLYLDATLFGHQLGLEVVQKSIETLEKFHALRVYPRGRIGVDLRALARIPDDVRKVAKAVGLSPHEIEAIERTCATIREIGDSGREANRRLTIWSVEIPPGGAAELLRLFVSVPPGLSREEVVVALRVGSQVYKSLVNRAPLDLFLSQLPRLAPERRADCLEAGRTALAMFKLRTTWYAWVESDKDHPQQPPYELWRHYERLLKDLEAG